jgi:DNA-binding transcriptional ArsR family regulator
MASRTSRPHPGFDPSRDVILDPRALRGLAHPIRLRLRAELAGRGPATATQLAARIGESSGTTSYHLRQLAACGFVTDEPGLGNGRDRYWRAVHRSTWFDIPVGDLEEREVGGEYLRAVARLYADRVVRFADSIEAAPEQLGPDWSRVAGMSDWHLDLSVEEAEELQRRFHELCAPYRHDPGRRPQGRRRVIVQFQVLPMAEQAP